MPLFQFRNDAANVERTFLFVHIPKCGGTTVETFFNAAGFLSYGAPQSYRFARPYLRVPPAHYDAQILNTLFNTDRLYSFAIVRDPLKRIISDFKWARTKSTDAEKFSAMSLENFVEYAFAGYQENDYFLSNHIKPQTLFIPNESTRIFKLENGLEAAIATVLTENGLNMDKAPTLPYVNKSDTSPVDVSDKAIEMVRRFYKDDYERFGYGD